MKKLRIISLLIILSFSFSVKAEVFIELDCNGKEITSNTSVTCEANLIYEEVSINDIELSYQTNLNVEFIPMNGFTITNSNNKVSLHTDTALYDEIMNSTVIMNFTLSANDKANELEKIVFQNIKINHSNEEVIDDIEQSFTVRLKKEEAKLDNVCTLDSITIDKEKIPNFSKDTKEYRDIYVKNEIVFIDAIRTSNKSSATGLGDVRVPKGETIRRDVIVTAEDGTKNTYKLFITNTTPKEKATISPLPQVTIKVTISPSPSEETSIKVEEKEKSNDNTLKKLELYNGKEKINFSFDSKKDNYDIKIEQGEIKKLSIKAETNDSKASFVANYGPRDVIIKYGDNKIILKIKAENGDEKTITLNVNYLDNRDKDNTLLSLKVNDKIIDLTNDLLEITLPNDVDKTKVEAVAKSSKATIKYEDIDLKVGDNTITITVIAENDTTKEYVIKVIREKDEEATLENIEIIGYNLAFSKDKKEYALKINNDVNKLDIKIIPTNIEYEISGNNDLVSGSKIVIKVNDSNSLSEYTIDIIKESSSNIIYYIIVGILILAGGLIIYFARKKKSKQTPIIEEI